MPTAPILEITDQNFASLVLAASLPTLVEFWAPFDAPSRAVQPSITKLANTYAGKLVVGQLDILANQDIPQAYGIRSIPTMLLFKGGKVVEQIVGAVPYSRIAQAVEKHL